MATAFEIAWSTLSASTRLSAQEACDARVRLARAILAQVHEGEFDPYRLSESALASFSASDGMDKSLSLQL